MAYIAPVGSAGYYDHGNQTSASATTMQNYIHQQQPSGGAAQDYYGTPHPPLPPPPPPSGQGSHNSTIALANLVPLQVEMHLPRQNLRLGSLYAEADRLIHTPTPTHEMRYIATVSDFTKWMKEVYQPKVGGLQSLINELEGLQQRLHTFAQQSASLGAGGYNFLTPHLEIGDVLDILGCVERRTEQVYEDILAMDELKIEIEATTNASECYNRSNSSGGRRWEEWKEETKRSAKRTFHSMRTARKKDWFARLSCHVDMAEKSNTPPYEAIVNEVARIESVTSLDDRAVLDRALTILRVLKDQGVYANSICWQARSDAMQQEEVLAVLWETRVELQAGLLQRQQEIIEENQRQAERENRAMTEHYVQFGEEPIRRLLGGMGTVSTGGYGTVDSTRPVGDGAVSAPPAQSTGFQMPLSWYSNMLTSQHVTNMQVMNNAGGGSTNFHLANSAGQIRW